MSDKISDEVFDTLPKKPNFLLVLALSGVAILVILAAAYLLISDDGKKLLHGTHPAGAPATSHFLPMFPSDHTSPSTVNA